MRRTLIAVLWLAGCFNNGSSDGNVPDASTGAPRGVADAAARAGLPGAFCTSSSECLRGSVCSPEETDGVPRGQCVAFCASDGDCPGNTGCDRSIVEFDRTRACSGSCSTNEDCRGDTPHCDRGQCCMPAMCLPRCQSTADCGPGRRCMNGFCSPSCSQDSECNSGRCNPYTGLCRKTGDADAGLPMQAPCTAHEQCLSGFCSTLTGRCFGGCDLASPLCPPQHLCVNPGGGKFGECSPSCTTDADCEKGVYCREVSQKRACAVTIAPQGPLPSSCASNADCPGAHICRKGKCFEFCQSSEDCKERRCDLYTGLCGPALNPLGAGLEEACTTNEDCRSLACASGRCGALCSVSRQGCPEEATCIATSTDDLGVCKRPCASNNDCPPRSRCASYTDIAGTYCIGGSD